jgi:hypothetical protein
MRSEGTDRSEQTDDVVVSEARAKSHAYITRANSSPLSWGDLRRQMPSAAGSHFVSQIARRHVQFCARRQGGPSLSCAQSVSFAGARRNRPVTEDPPGRPAAGRDHRWGERAAGVSKWLIEPDCYSEGYARNVTLRSRGRDLQSRL